MKYLADSDVLINHIRGKKYLDPVIITEGLGMSIISLGELFSGAYKSSNTEKSLKEIDQIFSLGVTVENLSHEIMNTYAKTRIELEKSGKKLDEFDLLIGATAIVNGLILITGNIKHFKRIKGLKIETNES